MSGRNDELREAVARAVFFQAFSPDDQAIGLAQDYWDKNYWPEDRPRAYRAADAILALPALANAEERARVAEARVRELHTLLDAQMGTPCEEIRHAQEVEALTRRVAELEGALRQAKHVLRGHDPEQPYMRAIRSALAPAALLPTEAARG